MKRRDPRVEAGPSAGRGHRWRCGSPAGGTAVEGEAARRGGATGGGRGGRALGRAEPAGGDRISRAAVAGPSA